MAVLAIYDDSLPAQKDFNWYQLRANFVPLFNQGNVFFMNNYNWPQIVSCGGLSIQHKFTGAGAGKRIPDCIQINCQLTRVKMELFVHQLKLVISSFTAFHLELINHAHGFQLQLTVHNFFNSNYSS